MECYACTNDATRQCRRCSRVYCEVHGGDLCAACLDPASALPSFNLYRGSLLALLVGTAVALWLLVRPPGSGNSSGVILPITPSPIVTETLSTPTPELSPSPTATAPLTPQARATVTPGATATAEPRTYVVEEGDTLIGIAERFAPPGVDPFAYAEQIASASGLSTVDDPIATGQTLVLP